MSNLVITDTNNIARAQFRVSSLDTDTRELGYQAAMGNVGVMGLGGNNSATTSGIISLTNASPSYDLTHYDFVKMIAGNGELETKTRVQTGADATLSLGPDTAAQAKLLQQMLGLERVNDKVLLKLNLLDEAVWGLPQGGLGVGYSVTTAGMGFSNTDPYIFDNTTNPGSYTVAPVGGNGTVIVIDSTGGMGELLTVTFNNGCGCCFAVGDMITLHNKNGNPMDNAVIQILQVSTAPGTVILRNSSGTSNNVKIRLRATGADGDSSVLCQSGSNTQTGPIVIEAQNLNVTDGQNEIRFTIIQDAKTMTKFDCS